jgi:hypothetical protein
MKIKKDIKTVSASIIVIIIILIVILSDNTITIIILKPDAVQQTFVFLGILIAVSLFMERSLEVFLTTWRAYESELLGHEISIVENQIKALEECKENDKINKKNEELEELKNTWKQYKDNTRKIALWAALLSGIAISLAGFRVLGNCLSVPLPHGVQKNLFDTIDIFLTGGMIAGGSDGLHKIFEIYNTFMAASKAKINS